MKYKESKLVLAGILKTAVHDMTVQQMEEFLFGLSMRGKLIDEKIEEALRMSNLYSNSLDYLLCEAYVYLHSCYIDERESNESEAEEQ